MIKTNAKAVAKSISLFNSAFFSASPFKTIFNPLFSNSSKVGFNFSTTSVEVIISGLTFLDLLRAVQRLVECLIQQLHIKLHKNHLQEVSLYS